MSDEPKVNISEILDAMERLMRMFAVERYVYLAITVVALLIILFYGYRITTTENPDTTTLVAIFGGSGLISLSAMRTTMFFQRAFSLFEKFFIRNKNEQQP